MLKITEISLRDIIFSQSFFFINGTTYLPNPRQSSVAEVEIAKSYQIYLKDFLGLTFQGVALVPPTMVLCQSFYSAKKEKILI